MPSLLDLPPELIELIFHKCEETAYEAWRAEKKDGEKYWPPSSGIPPFRSTCRYIEHATRRLFAKVYMGNGHSQISPKDADIEKFCAQAKVTEFAANKRSLVFGFDADIKSLELGASGQINSAPPSGNAAAHVVDNATGASVPSHLHRNRNAIVEAFRACKNLTRFGFTKYCDGGDGDPTLNEDEPTPFDITSSVTYLLSLAAEAGTRLEQIFVSGKWPGVQTLGISDGASLVQYKEVFQKLKYFRLKFIADPSVDPDELGFRLGQQVSEALAHMPVLEELNLNFARVISIAAWNRIANGPTTTISTLKELALRECDMDMGDFSKLLSNMTSLKHLHLSDVHLYKGCKNDLAQLLLGLADGPCELDCLIISYGGLFMDEDEEIVFSYSLYKPESMPFESHGEIEDDFDWIEVKVYQRIHWKGKDDIKWVLREMAAQVLSM